MSLKSNIEMVKDELNSEEKFFEKAVVTEKFVKKYKKPLIGAVVAVTLFVAGNIAYTISEQNRIDSANEAVAQLQKSMDNPATLARLESLSPVLHDVWVYSKAVAEGDLDALDKLQESQAALLPDLASYEVAQRTKNLTKLESYALREDAIYKDLAQIQSAVILMNINKIDEAHEKLSMINIQSPLSKVAQALMHYGVK